MQRGRGAEAQSDLAYVMLRIGNCVSSFVWIFDSIFQISYFILWIPDYDIRGQALLGLLVGDEKNSSSIIRGTCTIESKKGLDS